MKLYIETSVPNMLLAEDAPELQAMTADFFEWARLCSDEFFTSSVTEDEIGRAPLPLREKLLAALRSLQPEVLTVSAEAEGLAKLYLQEGRSAGAVSGRRLACGGGGL